jgi:hypothetical protein
MESLYSSSSQKTGSKEDSSISKKKGRSSLNEFSTTLT